MTNIIVISFTNLRDLPFLLSTISLAVLLAYAMRKGLSPGGRLQRYLKESFWKTRQSRFKRIARILNDSLLRKEMECGLEVATGSISKAREEILHLENATQEFLSQSTCRDVDGFDVGATYTRMVRSSVLYIYAFFLYIMTISPLFFDKTWSPIFISILIISAVIDLLYLVEKYGKGKPFNNMAWMQNFYQQLFPVNVENEQVSSEIQERLLHQI